MQPERDARTSNAARRALPWLAATVLGFTLALAPLPVPDWSAPRLALLLVAGVCGWIAATLAVREGLASSWIWIGALALRAAAFAAAPATSDDVERYAWEARVVRSGASPYAFAPDDPELGPLREEHRELHARVTHRDVPSIYPPLAQTSFLLADGLARGAGVLFARPADALASCALRTVACAWDLLVVLALSALARRRGLPAAAAAGWAWSPLVALEFAGGGHVDSLGILLWVLALALVERRRELAAVLLGFAGAVKLLPLAALPFVARAGGGWGALNSDLRQQGSAVRRLVSGLPALGLGLLAFAASFLPLLALRGGLAGVFDGLGRYALSWQSTSAVFRWVDALVRGLPYEGRFDPRIVARSICALAWLACAAWAWRRRLDPLRTSFVLVGAFLLLSPTLHPWYVAWIVPFLVFERGLAFRWLAAAAPLVYALLPGWRQSGLWSEPAWLWPVLFGPCLVLLAVDARRALVRQQAR